MDAGMIGGIAGGVAGVMGGVIGTYFGISTTSVPRERTLAIRLAAFCWLWIAAMVEWLLLMPHPWNQLAVILNGLPLMAIPGGNRRLARARAEDEADWIRRRGTGTPRHVG